MLRVRRNSGARRGLRVAEDVHNSSPTSSRRSSAERLPRCVKITEVCPPRIALPENCVAKSIALPNPAQCLGFRV
jgi:hypothetical protein